MSIVGREAIYAALFNLVQTAPGLVTTSRKLLHWNDVKPVNMPALFQAQAGQVFEQRTGLPPKRRLRATLYVYISTQNELSPGPPLNEILDYLDDVFDLTPAGHPQTLGGLVQYARIEGEIETSEGRLGNIEVAKIPVVVLVP